jgi:ComF family protein
MFLSDALLALVYPQRCRLCGDSVEQHRYGIACEACWLHIFTDIERIDANPAIGFYEGALRETVLELKRRPRLPRHVVDLLIERAKALESITRIVPVPLHEERLRARGFNQAAVIGREISKSLHVPLDEISLIRVSTPAKYRAGLDAKGRLESVAGAFMVRFPRLIGGEVILLVDDVFTTGATVAACEAALIEAGAKSVSIMTLARARH